MTKDHRTDPLDPSDVTVTIGDPTSRRISPDLWGLFLEDINYSLDGGLNADLVRNGDFETTSADHPGWDPLTGWHVEAEGESAVQVRSDDPLSPSTATYVRLAPQRSAVRLVNSGYGDGMPHRTPTHQVRLAARAPAGTAQIRIALIPLDARAPLAWTSLDVSRAGWTWCEADLPPASADRVRLVLEVTGDMPVDVDCVSLRPRDPATGEVQLFRPDLVAVLKDIRPSFMRFPGGCLAHGYGLDNMYHWKTTIGPRHERRHLPNTWGYHQSMAIGYYEYFLLCEEIGAAPLPVVAAGVSCQNTPGGAMAIPTERMGQYTQDVLDLVEFALGSPDTRWGAVRTALGHEAPFDLRYLGIGNEDEITPEFTSRFTELHDAVAHAHPEVSVIGTAGPLPFGRHFEDGWSLARRRDVKIVDEHMYRSPRWLLQNLERYDDYDREGPAVYLGEWAAKSNTVRSAVAEAAFMIAVERNGDVVQLASYAPLLSRVGATQWVPDLVYFTDDEVRPSANYYVQKMYSRQRGDYICPVTLDGADFDLQDPVVLSAAWLRSSGADVSYTDVKVDGTSLPDTSTSQDGARVPLTLTADATELSFTAVRTAGADGFAVGIGDSDAATSHRFEMGSWRNKSLILVRNDDGTGNEVDGPHPFPGVQTGKDIRVRIRVEHPWIRIWMDDRLIHEVEHDQRQTPHLVAGAATVPLDPSSRLVRLVNTSDRIVRVRLRLAGAESVAGSGELLAGLDPSAGAAFETSPVMPEPYGVEGSVVKLPPWAVWSGIVRAVTPL